MFSGRRFSGHLDFVAHNAHIEAVDFDAWIVGPGAVAHFEPPRMPGARYGSFVHFARTQRGPHVWAEIIDGHILTGGIEYGHEPLADRHGNPLPFGYRAYFRNGDKIGHGKISLTVLFRTFCIFYGFSAAKKHPSG